MKRALYLDPFEWIICYNLGLVHLSAGQFASAFHYLSASINLKGDFHASYMYLGVTLAKLGDVSNACRAYDKAAALDDGDHLIHLNYATTLLNAGDVDRAREELDKFQTLFQKLDPEDAEGDWDVASQAQALGDALQTHGGMGVTPHARSIDR